MGDPLIGSNETKSEAMAAFFHDSSFNSASIVMDSEILVVVMLFLF